MYIYQNQKKSLFVKSELAWLPPDLMEFTIQNVLRQAEAMTTQWAASTKRRPLVHFVTQLFETQI